MPHKRLIDRLAELKASRDGWTDEQILNELKSLPVLPDEYIDNKAVNPAWQEEQIAYQLDLYLALQTQVELRKLRAGVPLLLERASYGDMGETMRGLHHSLYAAFDKDAEALAAKRCSPLGH